MESTNISTLCTWNRDNIYDIIEIYCFVKFKLILYSGPSLQQRHLFPNFLTLNWVCCYKDYIFRLIKPFFANQNDVIKNFAVVMSVVIKRVDCSVTWVLF